jgi:hypothetical protein
VIIPFAAKPLSHGQAPAEEEAVEVEPLNPEPRTESPKDESERLVSEDPMQVDKV